MKKIDTHHDRQAKLLAELIDKKVDARVASVERTVSKMYKLFKQLKTSSAPKKIIAIEREMKSIKETISDFDIKSLEDDIFKQFKKINKNIEQSIENKNNSLGSSNIDISELRKKIEDLTEFENELMNLDISGLKRDIESVKTKTHWIELEMEKISLRPIIDQIKELETKIDSLRLAHPMVIE